MRPSRILSGALACALLLGACNDSADPEPAPLPNDAQDEPDGDDEEENAESDEIDVSTVPADPDDIDEAYVQAVMDEIDPIIQAVAVIFREVGSVEHPDVREVAFHAYTEASGESQLQTFGGLGSQNVKEEPGPPETEVLEIFERRTDCLVFSAERSFRPIISDEIEYDPVQPYYLRLVRNEPSEVNPTAWKLDFDGYFDDPEEKPEGDVCAS